MPFDIENSQALWRELPNLVMGTEADLILAATYKALQPPEVPPFEESLDGIASTTRRWRY